MTFGVRIVLAHLNVPSMQVYGSFMIFNLHFNEYTISPISLKRYSNLSQNSLKSWAEFGGSSLKAQGDAFRNVCLVRIIIRSLNSRSVSFSSLITCI